MEAGRELGKALVNGDPSAMAKILDLAKGEAAAYNGGRAATNDQERAELALQTFAPIHAAFDVINAAAAAGNQYAIDAVSRALAYPELQGPATESLGVLAGVGNPTALQMLTQPDKYGLLLSGSVGALKAAAENGNQQAIAFLAGVTQNQQDQALWFMAADDLSKAAAAGNPVAIDAMGGLLGASNQSARRVAIAALRQAVNNQDQRAAAALSNAGVY